MEIKKIKKRGGWNKNLKGMQSWHNISGLTKKGQTAWNKGKAFSEESRKKMSISQKGKKLTELAKEKISKRMKGEKNHNWKGGISQNKHSVKEPRYKKWRNSIFQRDNWTCQTCRIRGVYLEAHHIKSWAGFPQFRYDLENGVTLCLQCHKLTDNYKGKNNKNL